MRQVLLGIGVTVLLASTAQVAAAQHAVGSIQAIRDIDNTRAIRDAGDVPRDLSMGPPDRLCPLVKGASAEVNNYVTARLRQVAKEVGARYAPYACEPNMVVLFSSEPDRLLDEASRQGRINYRGVSGPEAERFKTSRQPVRWMHGRPGAATRDARPYNALVVVDAGKVADTKVSALADYVSMVTLADIRPGVTQTGEPSILNMFDGDKSAAPERLTDADKAYLRRVYKARRGVMTP